MSDLGAVVASTVGKVELESIGDDAPEERIVERLITKALHTTFSRHASLDELEGVVEAFEDGFTVETGDRTPSREYVAWMREVPGLRDGGPTGSARSTSPTARRSPRSSPRRSSSCSRACISRAGSTRTACPAGRSTTGDRVLPGSTRSGAGSDARRSAADAARPAADALARAARYSRWDGSQHVADLEADEILDALADDVMAEGDLAEALRRLMERGWRTGDPTRGDMAGLRDLMERLERQREEALERYELNDVLGDIRRELDEIVGEERAGVERRLDEASRTDGPADGRRATCAHDAPRRRRRERLDQLDGLPPDLGERIRGLQDYDFLEPNARERFDELVKRLQGQVLDQFVAGMSEAIQSMTPEDLAANREMVRDLNELIRERIGGGDPDASEFLAKHGRFFPGAQTLRRHHRPARPADGRHAVADALDEPAAARRARSR